MDAVKVRVWVHKSPIAGLGLFAAQEITKGTRILPYIGEKISKAESTRRLAHGNVYIFTFNDRYDIVMARSSGTRRAIATTPVIPTVPSKRRRARSGWWLSGISPTGKN